MKVHYLVLVIVLILTIGFSHLASAVRVYPYLLDPRENPDYDRYVVTHPSLEVFEPLPQFATLRSLPTVQSHLVNYTQLIDKFCLNPNTTLGGIVWPRSPDFMFADNYKDFVKYIKDKGLYVTSVHGFSPVSAGYRPPKEVLDTLEQSLGEKWFGMANGEQDGHYFGAFIGEELPLNNKPIDQYMNFRDYFDKMESILGPKMTTLLSSTYPHYQLKTGLYTMAGAETSQHGPNAQLRYAFIRGAGKQYGVIWFGNVSVYNRFGHKVYSTKNETSATSKRKKRLASNNRHYRIENDYVCTSNVSIQGYGVDSVGDPFGPTCGTSLNLMKRLMYAQMMYNSGYVSFEGGWFYEDNKGEELSPIGQIQHNAYTWTSKKTLPSLGTHLTTVALYLDYFSGWASPRQKRGVIYRTWTNLPYTQGDYLTDNLLRMIYPSYQDASYFHDETGVSSPTPYGDIMDVKLSDSPAWVLRKYDTVIVSSQLTGGEEVARNLFEYVQSGGNLVLTADNLAKLPNGYFNLSVEADCKSVPAGEKVYLNIQQVSVIESKNMTVCGLEFPKTTKLTILAWLSDKTPLVVSIESKNGGSLVVFATPYALSSTQVGEHISVVDSTLISPFPLLDHAYTILHTVLKEASIVQTTANLSVVTNYLETNQLLVLVSNPELKEQPLKVLVSNGEIKAIEEVKLDQSEKGQVGYLPDGYEQVDIGKSTATTIAGGDTRLFQVTANLKLTKINKPQIKPRPVGVSLHLRHIELSIRREILTRPTFSQHYDSVVIDYSYLITKDDEFLAKERLWLMTQGVRVYVDATPSINLFPTLRLTNDAPDLYNQSIKSLTNLLNKMHALGSQTLILSLHLLPGDQTKEVTFEQFNNTLHYLSDMAQQLNITLLLLDSPNNQHELMPMSRWLDANGLNSITFVLSLARLVEYGFSYKYDTILSNRTSMLYINAPGWDLFGIKYTDNEQISKSNETTKIQLSKMLDHVCSLVCCPYNTSNNQHRGKTKSHSHLKNVYHQGAHQKKTPNKTDYGLTCDTLPIVMDGVYGSQDDEYADVYAIEQLLMHMNT